MMSMSPHIGAKWGKEREEGRRGNTTPSVLSVMRDLRGVGARQ